MSYGVLTGLPKPSSPKTIHTPKPSVETCTRLVLRRKSSEIRISGTLEPWKLIGVKRLGFHGLGFRARI